MRATPTKYVLLSFLTRPRTETLFSAAIFLGNFLGPARFFDWRALRVRAFGVVRWPWTEGQAGDAGSDKNEGHKAFDCSSPLRGAGSLEAMCGEASRIWMNPAG